MSRIGPGPNSPNIHWQNRDALKAQLPAEQAKLERLDGQAAKLEGDVHEVRGQVSDLKADVRKLGRQTFAAEVQEKVGGAWAKLTGTLGRGLVAMGSKLGGREFSVTTVDIQQDPTAEKTSARLRAQVGQKKEEIEARKSQLQDWGSALNDLATGPRKDQAEVVKAHSRAITSEFFRAVGADVSDGVKTGIGILGSAAAAFSDAVGERMQQAKKGLYSGLKDVAWTVANFAADRELAAAGGDKDALSRLKPPGEALQASIASALSSVPVPVPVSKPAMMKLLPDPRPVIDLVQISPNVFGPLAQELSQLRLPAPAQPLALPAPQGQAALPAAQGQAALPAPAPIALLPAPASTDSRGQAQLPPGVELVDARELYRLPAPRTSREWVSMVSGVDYSRIGQEDAQGNRLRERDVDAALKTLGASKAIKYEGIPVKSVKQTIEKMFGLKEGASVGDVRREIDRRMAADVSPFTRAKDLEAHLAKIGLPPDADANQILQKTMFGASVPPM
jgi:hypothetical protein